MSEEELANLDAGNPRYVRSHFEHGPAWRPVGPSSRQRRHTALAMPREERARRLAKLRRGVEREDITWWLRRQFEDLAELVR